MTDPTGLGPTEAIGRKTAAQEPKRAPVLAANSASRRGRFTMTQNAQESYEPDGTEQIGTKPEGGLVGLGARGLLVQRGCAGRCPGPAACRAADQRDLYHDPRPGHQSHDCLSPHPPP